MVEENIRPIIEGFFKSFKCNSEFLSGLLVIENVPEKVQKVFGIPEKLELNFDNCGDGIFVNSHSELYLKIKNYLKNNPSKTLLRIDFEFPKNIKEMIPLRNCSIAKIEKKQDNNYFSRFNILTTFRYLSKTEQVLNEIYVHEGKIVRGDLSEYNVFEGKVEEASTDHLSQDYSVAKDNLKELVAGKIDEISKELDDGLNKEILRIEEHYSSILGEFNLNKSRLQERIKEATLNGETEKLNKLNDLFENNFSVKEFEKVLNDKKLVIENERMKFSLDVENKLINTTIIYYPIFKISLCLEEAGFKKSLEVTFNPLTNETTNFLCESCKTLLDQINVCHGGHICCSSCLYVCAECGKRYCKECMAGVCKSCGRLVCKNCMKVCRCKNVVCKNCMRISSLTGQERCLDCLGYCPLCSNIVEKNRMVRGSSGEMICKSCGEKKNR